MSTYEEANRSGRKTCTMRNCSGVAMGNPPRAVYLARGKKTDHGEPSGPRAASAASPWLYFRQSRLRIREEYKCARNF